MRLSNTVAEILRGRLDNAQAPDTYQALRNRLSGIQPKREPANVKESPENKGDVGNAAQR
jgi:hypothetical protein